MRTTADELREVARFIAPKLNRAKGPLTLLLPEGGLSLIDAPVTPTTTRPDPDARARARPQPGPEPYSNPSDFVIIRRASRSPQGMPFHDPGAMEALYEELTTLVEQTPRRILRRVPANINDDAFAKAAVEAFVEMANMAHPSDSM